MWICNSIQWLYNWILTTQSSTLLSLLTLFSLPHFHNLFHTSKVSPRSDFQPCWVSKKDRKGCLSSITEGKGITYLSFLENGSNTKEKENKLKKLGYFFLLVQLERSFSDLGSTIRESNCLYHSVWVLGPRAYQQTLQHLSCSHQRSGCLLKASSDKAQLYNLGSDC